LIGITASSRENPHGLATSRPLPEILNIEGSGRMQEVTLEEKIAQRVTEIRQLLSLAFPGQV
jgi:hypothetical protein